MINIIYDAMKEVWSIKYATPHYLLSSMQAIPAVKHYRDKRMKTHFPQQRKAKKVKIYGIEGKNEMEATSKIGKQ